VQDVMQTWLELNSRPGRPDFDLLLTTGDNAYRSGTNEQFQAGFFEPYASWLRNVPVWPVYGNHDARRWAFYNLFSFPVDGESGGLPSGTEHYYSFDHGQVHFVILDTVASSMRAGSSMLRWLEEDLIGSHQPWLIAVFHHPPYTHGSHNSDSRGDSGGRMFDVRENVLPILEQAGVDLALSGHSHMYERSHLMGCHYGKSGTLQPDMVQQPVSQNESALYIKPAAGRVANQGAIYLVLGSSSKLDQGPLDHPAMAASKGEMGALVVDINGSRLEGRFITDKGMIADSFAIVKGDTTVMPLQCTP
jgi:3',5'-cyclic AMP phosphodiesterase CpdA